MQTNRYPKGGVYPRQTGKPAGFSRVANGRPPLYIDASREHVPEYIRIYGNTVDGSGVGDATENIIRPTPSRFPSVRYGVEFEYENGVYSMKGTIQSGMKGTTLASFNALANAAYTFHIIPLNGYSIPPLFLWGNGATQQTASTTAIRNFTMPDESFTLALAFDPAKAPQNINYKFRAMAVDGTYTASTMPAYEPYGYKLPLSVQCGAETLEHTIYTDTPLYTPSEYAEITGGSLHLSAGRNIISTGTAVAPSRISVRYH